MGSQARRAAIASGAGSIAATGAALWAAATTPSLIGCYTHQCDPSSVTFDGGDMADPDTYETSSLGAPWLSYPPNVTLTVNYLPIVGAGRTPESIEGYIGNSPTPDEPNDSGVNFTTAAGNLAEYANVDGEGFRVVNSTCGQNYTARFVVHFAPQAGGDAAPVQPLPEGGDSGDAALADGGE